MKIVLALFFLLPFRLFADVTTSCQSVVTGVVTRAVLSDVCYTQYGDQFLQWQGYWDSNTTKNFTPVTAWQQSLNVMAAETGWRLPTIKELQLLTTKALVDVTNLPPDAFAENWMLQQWFLRDSVDAAFIPVADAYLLSSSYQGDSGNGTSKVFALNLATGLVEALAATDFDAKFVHVVKVKQSQPEWVNITTQYANTLGECLQHDITLSSDIVVSLCDGSVQQQWLVESNTGFIRSYSGGCLQAKTFSNSALTTYEVCSNSSTVVSPANSDRWDPTVEGSGKVFSNRSNSDYYFQAKSNHKVSILDYSSSANNSQNTWYISASP